MAEYTLVVTDRDQTVRAFLPVNGLSITRKVNSWMSCSARVDQRHAHADEIETGSALVLVYRDGVLRFAGAIGEPVEDDPEWVSFTAYDPYWWAWSRRLQADTEYTATEAVEIAWDLLDVQNARASLGVQNMASPPTTVARDRFYEAGKNVGEAIQQLAEVIDGFWFTCDPTAGLSPSTDIARMNFRHPDSGSYLDDVRFEYGASTLANLSSFRRSRRMPRNAIRATGQTGAGGLKLLATAEDLTSQGTYGLIEDEVSFGTVLEEATLQEHADELVVPDPLNAYVIEPVRHGAGTGQPAVPMLWDDFDVGDLVQLRIAHGRVDDALWVRVNQAKVDVVDESSAEQLSELVVEVVADPA